MDPSQVGSGRTVERAVRASTRPMRKELLVTSCRTLGSGWIWCMPLW